MPAGRPRKELDAQQVEELAAIGCTQVEIATVFGVAEGTIRHNFYDAYKKGHETAKMSLRRLQFAAANRGSVPMLIWLGKQYLGQKDKTILDLNSLTPEQALAILEADSGEDSQER